MSFHFTDAERHRSPSRCARSSGTQIVIITSPAPLPTTCPTERPHLGGLGTVTNIDNGDSDTANIGFNFQIPLPRITGISPNAGGTGRRPSRSPGVDFSPQNTGVIFGDPARAAARRTVHQQHRRRRSPLTVPPAAAGLHLQHAAVRQQRRHHERPDADHITVTDLGTGCISTFTNGFLLSPTDATLPEPDAADPRRRRPSRRRRSTVTPCSSPTPRRGAPDLVDLGLRGRQRDHGHEHPAEPDATTTRPRSVPEELLRQADGEQRGRLSNQTVKVVTVPP